ncbi:MAG: 16S rRNA processing protein RimM [Clostridia bacterium]|nr:16S rRNA processing protein RimM [Clostridia bacterium]
MLHKYLECGQIVRAHGINGAMIINHFCDSVEVFEALKYVYFKNGDEYKRVKVIKSAPYKNSVIVTLDGITTPEEVVSLRMKTIYADRNDIITDENDFFIVDLIGLEIKDNATNEVYGTLKEVINQGAQDIYVVKRENKPDAYIPAIKEFIAKISLEEGILITPIEGLLD